MSTLFSKAKLACYSSYLLTFAFQYPMMKRMGKRPVFTPIPKDNAQECSNYHTMAFISHANKVMLKILQARLQHYVNLELLGLEKAEEPEINCQHWLNQRKQASISASLTMWKPLTVWSQQTGKFLERGEYQTTLPVSWETCRQVKK